MTTMLAKDLIAENLGHKVRIEQDDVIVTGVLQKFEHAGTIVTDTRLLDKDTHYVLGRVVTKVEVLGLSKTFMFAHDETLTFLGTV